MRWNQISFRLIQYNRSLFILEGMSVAIYIQSPFVIISFLVTTRLLLPTIPLAPIDVVIANFRTFFNGA